MVTLRRRNPTVAVPRPAPRTEARPVLVATLEAPLVTEAAQLGVDSAVEAGQPLLVVNAVETMLAPCSMVLGYDYIAPPDVEESLRAPAELAKSLGVQVERFCLRSTASGGGAPLVRERARSRPARPRAGPDAHLRTPLPARGAQGSRRRPVPRLGCQRLIRGATVRVHHIAIAFHWRQ